MTEAEEIIKLLKLEKHPVEGGYFLETYRAVEKVPEKYLPERYKGARSFSTAIYYMLTPDTFSEMHRLKTDEVYHFYIGDCVEMLRLFPDGKGEIIRIGSDIKAEMLPQIVVHRDVWQGSKLAPGGKFALMGTSISPGFEFEDYEPGNRKILIEAYPRFKDMITDLTR